MIAKEVLLEKEILNYETQTIQGREFIMTNKNNSDEFFRVKEELYKRVPNSKIIIMGSPLVQVNITKMI